MQKKRQVESKPKVLQLAPVASVSELLSGARLDAFGVGPDKSVLFAAATEFRLTTDGMKAPTSYRVVQLMEGVVILDVTINDAPGYVDNIQVVGEELLLCVWSVRLGFPDKHNNGRFYSLEGKPTRSVFLGHAIKDVQADEDGLVWVSFAEANIYHSANRKNAIGDSGLVAWNRDGSLAYPCGLVSDQLGIVECTALNVASDRDVWLYYYYNYPLVLIRNKEVAARWEIPVEGSHALAVQHRHVLFHGAYGDMKHLFLFHLNEDGTVEPLDTFALADESGKGLEVDRIDHIVGRGDTLYLIADGSLYTLSLWEVLNA